MTDSFALHFVPDVDAGAGQVSAASHAACANLMLAAATSGIVERIGCFALTEAQWAACEAMLRQMGFQGEVEWIERGRPAQLERFGTLYHPGPDIARLAWRRLGLGERRYSLCGSLHGASGHDAMSAVAGLLAAPLRSWDAIVCPSRALRDSVRALVERQADYLRARFGAQRFELPQLPLISPGVHCQALETTDRQRIDARRELGIETGDVAFLYQGRLSFYASAHPQQMFSALEAAAAQGRNPGRRLHLVLCGPFDDDAAEQAFREAAALLCPSVRLVVPGACTADRQAMARAAADVFVSLADGMADRLDLAVLEAMAAGLPCLVSDWGGARDAVRDGVDGYRIATVMPGPGAGLDLAQRYDDGVDSYALYCGHISQAVALDGAALAQACVRLANDEGLRRQMGHNARTRARASFDWQVVFARYLYVWGELAERRRADAQLAQALPQTAPDRPDPFALFAGHPSAQITPASLVELAPDASLAQLRGYRELAINRFAQTSLPTLEEFGQIFGSIESRPMQVDELLDALGPCDRATLLRGLAWLCKMDLLRIDANGTQDET